MSGSPNIVLLYVRDVDASVRFYSRLFETQAVDAGPDFALFAFPTGLKIGLWQRDVIVPAAGTTVGGSEIGVQVDSFAAVDRAYETWLSRSVEIALEPTDRGFGRSFVGHDPDGHRLRVYCLKDAV